MKKTSFFVLTILALSGFNALLFPQEETVETGSSSDSSAVMSEAEAQERRAVERFWSILVKNPRRGTAFDRVYGYYVDTGQMEQLLQQCKKLTEQSPKDAKAWLLTGLMLSRRSDDQGTIEAYQKAESLDPDDAMSSYYLGEAYIAQGRLREAAEALERALERKPSKNDILPILQTLGRVYERFGDKTKSDGVWLKMEELFPNDLDILVRIAETLEEESKFDEALQRYQKLAQLAENDNYSRVRFTLSAADIKIRLGNKQEAINDFEKLLEELAGNNWLADSVRDRVERVFVRQADYAGLAGYYEKRLKQHTNDLDTVRRLAVALVRLARTDEAKTLLEETLVKAPSDIAIRLALIDLLVNDKEFEAVDEQYAEIDELDRNNPDHISQWGLAILENRKLSETDRKQKAAEIWTKLVDARPNDPAMIVMVADLMAGGKINDEAEKLYLRATELLPNDPSYREYLGYFYHRTEQREKAIETLKQIATENRKTAPNLYQLGSIFQGLGYTDEALASIRDAVELAPNDLELALHYGNLLLENGDFETADACLESAKKLVETDDEFKAFTQLEVKLLGASDRLDAVIEQLQNAEKTTSRQWWRLAVMHLSEGDMEQSTTAIEKALELEPESLLVLDTAADVYAKGYNQKKAAEICGKLAKTDSARRVDHLKRLANLQREIGQTDKALETAKLVMATGAGNAANSRFYADMLLSIGRRSDGIETLRRAVRIDPTDQVTLSALADQLAESGQFDEAIEILWRIFSRTEDLQGKMGVVGKMSNYYQMAQRFDQLIERLRQNANDTAGRREAAYCLAQAHASVGDYYAARNALEMLLTNVDEEKTSDTFLLSQLSRIAEMQGDLAASVRYQEMLCDLSSLPQDFDRLLTLYYASGEQEKASSLFLKTVTEKADFADQIDAIDKMLAQEDYQTAKTLLDRMETKTHENWELLYRKLQLCHWLKEGDPIAIAADIARLTLDPEELSAKKQKERDAANLKKTTNIEGQNRGMYGRGPNYSPWGFGQHHGYYASYGSGGSGWIHQWRAQSQELMRTLLREHLQLERYYYQRGSVSSKSPDKPLFKPETFGDAKFAAMAWEWKFAFDQDRDDFVKRSEQTEMETVPPPEYERFYELVDARLAEIPDDSNDVKLLKEKVRIHTLLHEWGSANVTIQMLETLNKKFTEDGKPGIGDLSRLEARLGMLGAEEWKVSAYNPIVDSLETLVFHERLESLDLDETITKWSIPDDKRESVQKELSDYKEQVRQRFEDLNKDSFSIGQKIDWVVNLWKESASNNPDVLAQLVGRHRILKEILVVTQREPEIVILDECIEKAGKEIPSVFIAMANTCASRKPTPEIGPQIRDSIRFGEDVYSRDSFDEIKRWILKARDATIANLKSKGPLAIPRHVLAESALAYPCSVSLRDAEQTLREVFGDDYVEQTGQYATVPSLSGSYAYVSVVPPTILPSDQASTDEDADNTENKEKRRLSAGDVDQIARVVARIGMTLDFYFEVQSEINTAVQSVAKKTTPSQRQSGQLSQYRYYFDGRNRLGEYEINRLMNPDRQGVVTHDEFLSQLIQPLAVLDYLIGNVDYEENVPQEKRFGSQTGRFHSYIAEKADSENESISRIARNFQVQHDAMANSNNQDDLEKEPLVLTKLAQEYQEARDKGESLPVSKMFLLAILHSQSEKYEQAIAVLDEIPFTSASDAKLRETIVLQLFQRSEQTTQLKERAEQAVSRLLGYQLATEELKTLRTALRQFDRNDEADAIRDRLLVMASDLNTMNELLQELRGAGDEKKDQAVQYALKIFRSPAVSGVQAMQSDSYARHVKSQALDVLKNAGKLEEIIEQIEAQWKSSPGSFEIMTSLADIYQRAGRADDAKKMVEEMEKQIPDDAQKMLSYAVVLRETGMKDEAVDWTTKALKKEPNLFFGNYWEYQRIYRDAKQEEKLLEFLEGLKVATILQHNHEFGNCLNDLLNNDKTKERTRELFDKLWTSKEIKDTERDQIQQTLVDNMIFNSHEEYYPYFHEVVMRAISVPKSKPSPQAQQVIYHNSNPHDTRGWSSDRSYSLSGNFIETAEKKELLGELDKQVKEITAAHLEMEADKRDWNRYACARILEAMIDIRLKNMDAVIGILEELHKEKKMENTLANSATAVVQELEKTDDSRAMVHAIRLCETAIKQNAGHGGFVDSFLQRKLIMLYLKSDQPEKGRELGLATIRKNLRLLRLCGTNHHVQVGNHYYGIHELSESIKQIGNALKNTDCAMDLLLLYRTECEGQPWFETLMKNNNMEYYARQVKEPFDGISENVSVDNFVKFIDLFIPNMQSSESGETSEVQETDDTGQKQPVVRIPLELGVSFGNPIDPDSKRKLITSKMQQALQKIATDDPEKFAQIGRSLETLEKEHPEEPTVLLVNVFYHLAADDAEKLAKSLETFAGWIESGEKPNLANQVYIAAWTAAREVYTNPEKYDAATFGAACETMTLFASQFVGKSMESGSRRTRNQAAKTEGDALLEDIRHFAAQAMEGKIQIVISQKTLYNMIMEGSQVISNIDGKYSDIHEHFLSVVRMGNAETLLRVFEEIFANGKKSIEGNSPETSYIHFVRLFHLLESVLIEAEENGVDPNLVYESLLKIVVREKAIFAALYADPGGLNGRFYCPAFMLIDWSLKAGRADELLELLKAKREIFEHVGALDVIDSMEFALTLKTGQADRAAELNRMFLDKILRQGTQSAGVSNAIFALWAIDSAPLAPERLELLDAALALNCENDFTSPIRFNRYAYYLIRKHWFDILDMSGDVQAAARRLTWYRQIATQANHQSHPFRDSHKLAPPISQQPDGLRRLMEDRLFEEGMKSLVENDLPAAVAVLRYFADEPVESQYYRDLGAYLDLLAEKTTGMDDNAKQELLGDLLTVTARTGSVASDVEAGKPRLANDHDLPTLPEGTRVYENDFETDAGPNWSHKIRAITPTGKRSYLGAFNNDDVVFKLNGLPEHKFLRIRFDLFILGVPEGVMGGGNGFGPDTWEMTIDDRLKPIGTTFANFRQEEYSHKQSYPDDLPSLFGRPFSWQHRIAEEDFWSEVLETGFYLAREGAAEERALGYFRDAVYAIDIIVPHDGANLKIDFRTLFTDDPLEVGHLADFLEESWGIDNFRIDAIDDSWEATDEQLQLCFDALITNDGKKANAARWRLVAAGDRTVDWLEQWAATPDNDGKLKKLTSPGSFTGFRVFRVLQLIDTPKAKASRFYAESEKPISSSLMDKIKVTISAESLKSSLFQSGAIVDSLEYSYYDIIDQYVAAVETGNTENVLSVFRDIFKNGWPGLGSIDQTNMNYNQAVLILRIFDAVLDAAEKNNVDPDVVVDALLDIVLPADKKDVFLGLYDDLGGISGYFRSPAVSLVRWIKKADRLDWLGECIEKRVDDPSGESLAKDDPLAGLALAMTLEFVAPDDNEVVRRLREKFLKWVKEDKSAISGRMALAAIAEYGIRPDTVELFDASLELCRQGPHYSRFACYVIRKHWNDLFESGNLKSAIHWLEVYRRIARDTNNDKKQDAFRHVADDRLHEKGLKSLDENNLETAVAILRYFAQENVDSFRYRDLGVYLDRLNEKLSAMDEAAKSELLGDLNLSQTAREGNVVFDSENAKPKIAESFGLPPLPSGTVVYEHDFQTDPGEHWSSQKRDITAKGKRPYLGEFVNEPVTFRLDDLPEHKFLRIRFDLFMMEGLDGLVGYGSRFGVDSWEMTVDGETKPIASTFSNYRKDDFNQKQSYPDDYPPLLGITHSWQHRVESEDVWGDDLETGLHYGREGAVEHNSLTCNKSAVYPVDIMIPHEKAELLITFIDRFIDGPYELGIYHQSYGECWGLANFHIETLENAWEPTEEELDRCLAALFENDGNKANAARWRLVAAGEKTVDALAKWVDLPDNEAKLKEVRSPGNFYGFRLKRVLDLIGSQKAKDFKEKLFVP